MVNWDPKRQTALSDEEVYHKDVTSKFYTVQYQIEGSDEYITIATTRPETIMQMQLSVFIQRMKDMRI